MVGSKRSRFPHQMQKRGRIPAHARHLHQLLLGCLQHPGEAAKPIQQMMRQLVGAPAGNAEEQDQFQRLNGMEFIQSIVPEAIHQSLSMSVVN